MSTFWVSVKWTSFLPALVISVALHLAGVGALVISGHWQRDEQRGSMQVEFARIDSSAELAESVAIAIEPLSQAWPPPAPAGPAHEDSPSASHPREVAQVPAAATPIIARAAGHAEPDSMSRPRAIASNRPRQFEPRATGSDVDPPAPSVNRTEVLAPSPESSVDSDSLRRAMKSAAAQSSSPGNSSYQMPMVRVDPSEKNLDRAWSRAFAWAFATDRSFFAQPPTGTARFVLELADNGAIQRLHWLTPSAPDRLAALIQRMVKLLSRNRFSPPSPESEHPRLRGFEMKVSATRVPAPTGAAATPSVAGDLWMLEAGEIPRPGHPSRPMVADMTGHQINCVLRILDALPDLGE